MSYLIVFSDQDDPKQDFDALIKQFDIKIDPNGKYIPNSVLELQENDDNGFVLPHLADQYCERISTSQYRDRNS